MKLKDYVDDKYTGDIIIKKSIGVYIFTAAEAPIGWAIKRQ